MKFSVAMSFTEIFLFVYLLLFVFSSGANPGTYIAFSFCVFVFHDILSLKKLYHLFCRLSFNLHMSDVSPWVDSGYSFGAGMPYKSHVSSSQSHTMRHVMALCSGVNQINPLQSYCFFLNNKYDFLITKCIPFWKSLLW